ncbi:uncharacterized protein LOC125511165 isoform X1 [Triticum urartu]|uniref:uncharacterized protein LOC125511165 isoform X1 n=1 Tax=Triticum urartu TaxID=4572 RepID=UPI002044C899|nr:uncharacterized protein LOC125511165 isoform X1 [Triticum urartu]XP_048532417.1 uncharacterized protein LOC125511165 isoform X1 [Triticum urartu]
MDRSRASSSEAVSGQKRGRDGSGEAAADLEYEAALRAKLQASLAPEPGPAAASAGVSPRAFGSGPSVPLPPPVSGAPSGAVDPWEQAAAASRGGSSGPSQASPPLGAAPRGGAPLRAPMAAGGGPSRFFPRGTSGAPVRRPVGPAAGRGSGSGPVLPGDGILPPPRGSGRIPPQSQVSNPILTCFACHRPGHFQSWCENPPFCLICREDGHLTVDCQNRVKPPAFVHYGTDLPGCSSFALDRGIPEAAPILSLSNVGIISVQAKRISSQTLLDELQQWDEGGWDWQIRQLSEFDFAATFPSKESLRMISSCTSFTLPLNQLVVSVKAASRRSLLCLTCGYWSKMSLLACAPRRSSWLLGSSSGNLLKWTKTLWPSWGRPGFRSGVLILCAFMAPLMSSLQLVAFGSGCGWRWPRVRCSLLLRPRPLAMATKAKMVMDALTTPCLGPILVSPSRSGMGFLPKIRIC